MSNKPFAAAAHQNQDDILQVLQNEFRHSKNVLEIGSGTGQHAAYFSEKLPHLTWQASDKDENIAGISMWIDDCRNTPPPITLDVLSTWPQDTFDSAFAANVTHIMHWNEIEAMFAGLSRVLSNHATFCLYGPFNLNGAYTSESNKEFDQWIQNRDPLACIRDKGDLNKLAKENNLIESKVYPMPANNMIICWKKIDE